MVALEIGNHTLEYRISQRRTQLRFGGTRGLRHGHGRYVAFQMAEVAMTRMPQRDKTSELPEGAQMAILTLANWSFIPGMSAYCFWRARMAVYCFRQARMAVKALSLRPRVLSETD